jgi:DNA mismatch repair protein MutL
MQSPRIAILPPEIAERIAAGEVVERPASAVKELVENALDAGATRITVETEAGGKELIRVTDDGCGMTRDEAPLALRRHATSKLRSAEDLFNIRTLGFRGEALPSIAAVSNMEIVTRPHDSPEGTRVLVEGGEIRAVEAAPAQAGTSITIRRLFYNVPVRERFLRADGTEAQQITDWLQRLALSRPDVSFRLTHDGREALLSPGSKDPLNAVVAVLGRAMAREMLPVSSVSPRSEVPAPREVGGGDSGTAPLACGVTVSGYVGRPTLTRSSRGQQHFYVNGRSVRSPLFYRAVDDAFRSTMPQGRHPVIVMFVELPPDTVDVNVHPAKTEVRFRDDSAVHQAVFHALREALKADAGAAADDRVGDVGGAPVMPAPERSPMPSLESAGFPEGLPFAREVIGGRPAPAGERFGGGPTLPSRPASEDDAPAPSQEAREAQWDPFEELPALGLAVQGVAGPQASGAVNNERTGIGELHLLGQAQDLFILAVGGGRLWIIDQHVAHERVLFDRMTAVDAGRETAEPLLLPVMLTLTGPQSLALEEHAATLKELGFRVEAFGPARFRLSSVPRSLLGLNYEQVFRDLVDELAEQSQGGRIRLRKEEVALAAAGRSCKSAVKAGQRLSRAEMEQLLRDLREARNPHTCPHGRPVFLEYDQASVGALFGGATCEGGC